MQRPTSPRALVVSVSLFLSVHAASGAEITRVDPDLVLAADARGTGGTQIAILGRGFERSHIALLGRVQILDQTFVDSTRITGRVPPLAPGIYGLDLLEATGAPVASLPNAVEVTEPVAVASVNPSVLPRGGGVPVTVSGRNFRARTTIRFGSHPLEAPQVNRAGTEIAGIAPALSPGEPDGAYDVVAEDSRGRAILPRGVTYETQLPAIRSVEPAELSSDGGDPVTIRGARFLPDTVFRFGGAQLLEKKVAPDGTWVTGLAPANPPGEVDVSAEDSRGRAVLPRAARYVDRWSQSIPAPQVTDTALAYGIARFEWENGFQYDAVEVLDEIDRVIDVLPGNAQKYEIPSGGEKVVALKFRGVTTAYGPSLASLGLALVHQCEVPPPLIGLTKPGKLNFVLYGDHAPSGDDACAGGGGSLLGAQGSGAGSVIGNLSYPANGFAHIQAKGGSGYILPDSAYLDIDPNIFKFLDRTKLTTGFTLETPADKLEIAVFARKLGVAANLELRGRLIHVFPDDGFAAEFSFPDTIRKPDKEWIRTTFYRSFVDSEGQRHPCLDGNGELAKIPAGDYLLDLYAVGGDPTLPYYEIADDPLDVELLIAGSPCPPYPMVRVTDLTGFRSVPEIQCIKPKVVFPPSGQTPLTVNLRAQGVWLDFDNTPYRIQADPALCSPEKPPIASQVAYKNSPDFEYHWSIHQKDEIPTFRSSGNSPTLSYQTFPDWGCYKVELTVRDKRCGLESKYSQEIVLMPDPITCDASKRTPSVAATSNPPLMRSSYLFPTPDLASFYGVVGLKPPPGSGRFEGTRPVEFRVLVVPCYCGTSTTDIALCPSPLFGDPEDPSDDDIEFRLALKTGNTYTPLANARIVITDCCEDVSLGPKYILVRVEDIGEIPYQPSLGQGQFLPVFFQARNRFVYNYPQNPGQKVPGDPDGSWRNVGNPIRLANRPDSLTTSFWSGHFEPGDASYHFVVKSAKDTLRKFDLGASPELPLNLPDVNVSVPGHPSNAVTTGFTTRFAAVKGQWFPEEGVGDMQGSMLGNDLKGEPIHAAPKVQAGGAGAEGQGAGLSDAYVWCTKQEIFKNKFSTKLFEAVIFAGTIGPIPVTVWGSIGLGLDFLLEAYGYVRVAPFAPVLGNGNFVESYFDLLSRVKISIPSEIRADILAGIASVATRLRPESTVNLIPYFSLKFPQMSQPQIDFFLQALFSLYFEVEACIQTLILGEQCFGSGEIAIVKDAEIFATHGSKPVRPPSDCLGSGGSLEEDLAAVFGPGDGRGADVIVTQAYQVAVAPMTIVSPDRKTVIDAWVTEDAGTLLQLRANEYPIKSALLPYSSFYLIDPAGAFVSNDAAIVAWTSPAGQIPLESVPPRGSPQYLPVVNANAARAEVQVATIYRRPGFPPAIEWTIFDTVEKINILDTGQQSTWRVDGRPSVAGDLAAGEALVAWVRYDTPDFLVQDGTVEAVVPCEPNEFCFCGSPPKPCRLKKVTVPNYRPQIERTAIYARRVGYRIENPNRAFTETRAAPFKLSPPGINIQPSIAASPSGAKAYCVWLHDGTPGRKNLLDSNRGRQILCAVYTKNVSNLDDPAQWAAPFGVLAVPDDYPGLLDPKISLKADDTGLLVFTALEKGAPERDSGLGVGRYLYASRLEGGVFGAPFRVHGKCLARQYGYEQTLIVDIPVLIDPLSKIKWKNPEWVMVFQELGDFGSRPGSGNVKITTLAQGSSVWSNPLNLTPDENMHTNVAATIGPKGIHSIHLDGGPATLGFGAALGSGGALSDSKTFVTMDTPLEPDPAIAGLRVDFPYASPGSTVRVEVDVENLGIVGTPVSTDTGESVLGVRTLLLDRGGREIASARSTCPELAPGQRALVALSVEVPLDPATLRVELVPGPRDRDFSNNVREIPLGTPAPEGLVCRVVDAVRYDSEGNPIASRAVLLEWSNPVAYDEIAISRDGKLVAALPGISRAWVDEGVSLGPHLYEVRGRILVSKSERASCAVRVDEPGPLEAFRRGDADRNQRIEITDAIFVLNYLFLGGTEPFCPDAADADDNGELEITDPIRLLGYLFLGGAAPPAPGPTDCGPDPTPDALPPCRGECR